MKIQTQTELLSDPAKVAELPLVPAPGEAPEWTRTSEKCPPVIMNDGSKPALFHGDDPAPVEASTELPKMEASSEKTKACARVICEGLGITDKAMQAMFIHEPVDKDLKSEVVRLMHGTMENIVAEAGIPGVCEPTLNGIGEPAQSTRPSLDVAIENLANLTKHVEPFVGRLRAWDTSKLTSEVALKFTGSVEDLAAAFVRLNDQLTALKAMGYVAKTTPISRLRAKLQVGSKVKLTTKAHEEFSQLFDDTVLGILEVAQLRGQHAFLKSSDGTALGAVKLSCIELV